MFQNFRPLIPLLSRIFRKQRVLPSFLLIFLIMQAISPITKYAAPGTASPEETYFQLKKSGDYAGAIAVLQNSIRESNDPVSAEVDLLRIRELMSSQDLNENVREALKFIKTTQVISNNPFLRDRLDSLENILYLRSGDFQSSQQIMSSLAYLDFNIMGPFPNNSRADFEKPYPPQFGFNRGKTYNGTHYPVTWFQAQTDRTGVLYVRDYVPDVKGSFFYLYRAITIPADGDYLFILGKTGFTDLWIDGTPVFSSRVLHGHDHDQYLIRVRLSGGSHRVMLKAGDSPQGLAVSLRITDALGNRIPAGKSGPVRKGPPLVLASGFSLFPSLSALKEKPDSSPEDLFTTGFLILMSRLDENGRNSARTCLAGVPPDHPRYSPACLYLARTAADPIEKDNYLKQSIDSDPRNIEALNDMIQILLSRQLLFEALPLIKKIHRITPGSPWYRSCLTQFFFKKKWNMEALQQAEMLKKSRYPSLGYALSAEINRDEGAVPAVVNDLDYLHRLDRWNSSYYSDLADLHEKMGHRSLAINLLMQGVSAHPTSVSIKLRLAELIRLREGPAAAVPYLSSALSISPYRADAVRAMGILYQYLGNEGLALYYLDQAARYAPGNYNMKRRISILKNEPAWHEAHSISPDGTDPKNIPERYRHEPAVVLIDENIIRVNADGSYERRVFKSFIINDPAASRNFTAHAIHYDPDTETVEDQSCVIIHDGRRMQIPGWHREPPSDPAQLLEKRCAAFTAPLPALSPGDVIEVRCTIRHDTVGSVGPYFEEKLHLGGPFPILVSSTVLIYPADRTLYCRVRGLTKSCLSRAASPGSRIFRIRVSDILAVKPEISMPHRSSVLPAIYFSPFRNWRECAAWYRPLLRDRIIVDDSMRKAWGEVISDTTSPLKKVQAVYSLVAGASLEEEPRDGNPGILPRFTDKTFHSKGGSSRDRSLLLAALLRDAGIDARPALARTRDRGPLNNDAPAAIEFNRVLCYVNIDGGFFIDVSPYSGLLELPDRVRGINALVIDDAGERFINTGSGRYTENYSETKSTVTISEAGDGYAVQEIMKQGDPARSARKDLLDPRRFISGLGEYWNKIFPGSAAHTLVVVNRSSDNPARYRHEINIPSMARSHDTLLVVPAFLTHSGLHERYCIVRDRKYPIVLPAQWRSKVRVTLVPPPGYRVNRMPRDEHYEHPLYTASFNFVSSGGAIISESVIHVKSAAIDPGQYDSFRNFTRFIDTKEREYVLLKKE